MINADEARKIADESREPYLSGLLSHYMAEAEKAIKSVAQIGRCFFILGINEVHFKDVTPKLRRELKKLGFKTNKGKTPNTLEISWEKEVKDGSEESSEESP